MTSMTSNQPATIDETGFVVRRTIAIAAPVEKVWSAVTEPEHISRWFGTTKLDGTQVGSQGSMSWPGRTVPLRIEAVDEPNMVAYRWNNDDARGEDQADVEADGSTVFTFTLEPVAEGTRLTVVEAGFEDTSDPSANMESHREGWDGELDKLVALFEDASQ